MQSLWSSRAEDFDVVMTWAACSTAFFGFFRIGEITEVASSANCVDIVVDNHQTPTIVKIYLRHFETDQFGRGVDGSDGRRLVLCVGNLRIHDETSE